MIQSSTEDLHSPMRPNEVHRIILPGWYGCRMAEQRQRIAELDGIRGLAILMVLFWHYFGDPPKYLTPDTFVSYLMIATRLFWSGVDLFFILSGYLICGIILDNHSKQRFLTTFFIRRAARILPLYCFLLLLYLLLRSQLDTVQFSWLFSNPIPFWSYVTFLQNVMMGVEGHFGGNFLGISWSLAVEEQFYLLAPLTILIIGRQRWIRGMVPLIVLAAALRVGFSFRFFSYVNTPFRMDSLLLGGIIAVLIRNNLAFALLRQHRSSIFWTFVVGVILIATISFHMQVNALTYSVFGLFYAVFLLTVILYRDDALTGALRWRPLRFCGSIAYGLYMYHQAVNGLFHGMIRRASPSLETSGGLLVTLLALVVTFMISIVSFRYFECWFVRIGHSFDYGECRTDS
jgi:peptidoglycan/LPS O-acetylase OafA/YrhL